jgi:predicted small lipoprotein YifL
VSAHRTQRPATVAVLLALAVTLVAGCGKKGPPLPPLQRIPVAPPDLTVGRIDEDVYVRFAVPTVNIDGMGPADVAHVEVYAVTTDSAPSTTIDPDDLRELATLVGREVVRRPLPPRPPPPDGQPSPPMPPPAPGVDQGSTVVFRERLTQDARTPLVIPDASGARSAQPANIEDVARPLVAPPASSGPQRYYFAVAVSGRGRYGPFTGFVPAPLGPTSSAPGEPAIEVEETRMVLRWAAPPDVRADTAATEPDLLPSRPIVPGPEPTTYDVYDVPREAPADAPVTFPVPLTPAPVTTPELVQSDITLGIERCFIVRPVDIVSGIHVRGPASPMVCAPFADTFAPAPPTSLESIATSGVISLLWEGSDARDLAGYVVLRGEPGSATLTPLTPEPIRPTTYRDETVRPGQTYVYAVVAVDVAGNLSQESNRVEETARQ